MINFLEYLKEEVYIAVDKRDISVPFRYHGKEQVSNARSPRIAFNNVRSRLLDDYEARMNLVKNYIMVPYDEYKKANSKYEPLPEPPPVVPKENPQMDWGFGIDRRPPD